MTKRGRLRAKLYFAWFDFWVGWYYQQGDGTLYIQLVPMFGVCIWREQTEEASDAR